MRIQYTLVENSGTEGECDICSFDDYTDAINWRDDHYKNEEIKYLKVEIIADFPNGFRVYEI